MTCDAAAVRKGRHIGPYSRHGRLCKLDGRTREAALMRHVRKELIAHVGGHPNPVQRALIERAVILTLRVAQIDTKILQGEVLSLHDSNYALAWNNSLRRTLTALGVDSVSTSAKPQPSLAELIRAKAAQAAAR